MMSNNMFQNSVIRLQILVLCHFKNAKLKISTLLREHFFQILKWESQRIFLIPKFQTVIHLLILFCCPIILKMQKLNFSHSWENEFLFFQILKFWSEKRQRIFCLRRSGTIVDTFFQSWLSWKMLKHILKYSCKHLASLVKSIIFF